MSILIVDDFPNSRLVLKTYLKNEGYADLITAAPAQNAFKYSGMDDGVNQDRGVDLILMDIMMPQIDGIEACRRIKSVKWLRDIPIIVVTSFEEVEYLEEALAAGALDYMTKPVNPMELRARVRSALELKREVDRRKLAYSVLEKLFLQSQKMEGFGRLAGTLAHDIRNMLTPIIGYAQLGMMGLPPEDDRCIKFQEIRKAADHASDLTNRMLVSLRRQAGEPQVINLNHLIEDIRTFLRSLIGEDIELVTVLDQELWPVKADHILTEQVLMNLAVNARDAMAHGGVLAIETANRPVEQGYNYEGLKV
jgi:CheY-like chemotaxis protein